MDLISTIEAAQKKSDIPSFRVGDTIKVHFKIIEGKTGLFIAMPSRKTANGEYKDVAHPISPEFRTELQDKILAEYEAGHIEEGDIDDI